MPVSRFRRPVIPRRDIAGTESQKLNVLVHLHDDGELVPLWSQWLPAILTGGQDEGLAIDVERSTVRIRTHEGLKYGATIIRSKKIWRVIGVEAEGDSPNPSITRLIVESTGREAELEFPDLVWGEDVAEWA